MRSAAPICLVLAAIMSLATIQSVLSADELSHAIFVKVNGKNITQQNVRDAAQYIVRREYNNVAPHDEEELEKIQKAALRDLVRTILIHDEAGKLNLKVDRSYARQTMAQLGLRNEDISPTIRRMLEADDLFMDIMLAEGTPILDPNPKQMRDFYIRNRDQFRTDQRLIVRTIFIADEGRFSQDFYKQKADKILRDLEAVPAGSRTEAVDAAARASSQDVFAQFGGLLTGDSPNPWIPRDFENIGPDGRPVFPPTMVEEIRRMNRKGELRLAVSEEGMHILYCQESEGGRAIPWEEATKLIDYILKQRQRNSRMRNWLSRVYSQSDVRWHDGSLYDKETLTEILLPSERAPTLE